MSYEQILVAGAVIAAGGMCLLALLRCPALGLAALTVSGLLVPIQFETATKTTLNVPFLIAPVVTTVWLFGMADRRRAPGWIRSASSLPLLLFMLVSCLSLVVGQFQWFPAHSAPLRAQLGGLSVLLLSGGAFFLSAHLLRDLRWLKGITYLFLSAGALRIVLLFIPGLPALATPLAPAGTLGSLFWTWLVALAFAQALANRALGLGWRLALAALVVAALYVAIVRNQEWASGWVPACVALTVVVTMRYPRFGFVLGLSGLVVAVVNQNLTSQLLWSREQSYSLTTRIEAAKVLSGIIRESPLLGFGPANYYYYTDLRPILGWYVKFSSHNNYVDILAQTGLVGLGCFLWFLVAVARVSLRLREMCPGGFPKAFVYGAIGGLAGTMCAAALGDWLLPFVYNVGLKGFSISILAWVFLGGLVALEQNCGRVLGEIGSCDVDAEG